MDRQVQGHELSSSLKVKNAASRFLLVQNEGSRCLQIIGEAVTNDVKILPGSSAEIVIRQPDHPVQMTFYDGGVQIDYTKRPGDSLPTTTAEIGT
jgi:nitrate/nitrite-specific signal transduction histidine kinase